MADGGPELTFGEETILRRFGNSKGPISSA